MNILIIGSGGREHCLGWKIAQSLSVKNIYFTGTNAGFEKIARAVSMKIEPPFSEVIDWSKKEQIDLVVVGPEDPLAHGIVDALTSKGIRVFGPSKKAAQIEGSKVFAKNLMLEYGIPTAKAESFADVGDALMFLRTMTFPVVIKAEGLAAGKGVVICEHYSEAEKTIKANLEGKVFGAASNRVLIEEFLVGEEASLLAFVDGATILPMITAQDHKPVYDNDRGPNTGGMGAYAPAPLVNSVIYKRIIDMIMKPTLNALKDRGITYKGVLYAGLMLTEQGPKVLEFNCRFGDPETQAILPLLDTDLIDIMNAVIDGRLDTIRLCWRAGAAVCVILASGGYPGSYEKGKVISGLDTIPESETTIVFHAGTKCEGDRILTNGGRVLGLTTVDSSIKTAISRNYELIKQIKFEGAHYRSDIGRKALKYL